VAVSYNQGTDQYTIYNINATGGDLTVPSATFESGDLSITGSTNLNIYINLDHGVVLVDDPH
jgi:hypothetical protein